jgi:hypothetical protein
MLDNSKTQCKIIVIDNFYENPCEIREFILKQDFLVVGNYPGKRTESYANQQVKNTIQKYIEPYGGKITIFPTKSTNDSNIYNGSFQYTTSRDRSWIHVDSFNNWAGILYLTPNAPLSSGTNFYEYHDGTRDKTDMINNNNEIEINHCSQDLTKWKLVDSIGNKFNRLVLFRSDMFHMSGDYFGDCKENGRLFQVFFFSTEW